MHGIKEIAPSKCSDLRSIRAVQTASVASTSTADRHLQLLRHPSMANYVRFVVVFAIIIGMVCGEESSEIEDVDKNIFLNLPYGRGLDSELQLVKLMMLAPRFCHPKRNSELINSLLGLPKNMHNVGK